MTPLRWRVTAMWSCAMLTPRRTSRSLMAHFIAQVVRLKSAMIWSVSSLASLAAAGIVWVT